MMKLFLPLLLTVFLLGCSQSLQEPVTEPTHPPYGSPIFEPASPPPTPTALPATATPEPTLPPTPSVIITSPPTVYAPPVVAVSGEIEQYICSFDWDCSIAICIAHYESGPADRLDLPLDGWYAQNGAVRGLFQIHEIHAGAWPDYWTAWHDPYRNTQFAYDLYTWKLQSGRPGFEDWDGSPQCWAS